MEWFKLISLNFNWTNIFKCIFLCFSDKCTGRSDRLASLKLHDKLLLIITQIEFLSLKWFKTHARNVDGHIPGVNIKPQRLPG